MLRKRPGFPRTAFQRVLIAILIALVIVLVVRFVRFDFSSPIVQAALIAGFISFINVLSTWGIKAFEGVIKRQDWRFEKQTKDVEEIIVKLDRFLKDFSKFWGDVNISQGIAVRGLEKSFRAFKEKSRAQQTASAANVEELAHEREKLARLIDKSIVGALNLRTWINYDSLRLTVWFDDSEEIKKQLFALEKLYLKANGTLAVEAYKIDLLFGALVQQGGELSDEGFKKILLQSENLEKAMGVNEELVNATVSLRRELVSKLR